LIDLCYSEYRLAVFTSKFRKRRYIKLDKSFWASYLERGDINSTEASVLFLHGFSGSAVDFVGILPKLPEKYHVVGIDLPNHGYSTCRRDKVVTPEDMTGLLKKVLFFFTNFFFVMGFSRTFSQEKMKLEILKCSASLKKNGL